MSNDVICLDLIITENRGAETVNAGKIDQINYQ